MAEDLHKFDDDVTATLPPPPNFKDPALVTSTEEEVRISEESRADASEEDSIVSESRADTTEAERIMESPEPVGAIYSSHSILPPVHRIQGEPFYIEREHGLIYLTHERWSLTGMGENLLEAERDLIEEARVLAPIYLEEPLSSFTIDAVELRDFILRVI